MATTNRNKHLTLEERRMIEEGIRTGSTKMAIAKSMGKDNTTIAKEISLHRKIVYRTKLLRECKQYKRCRLGRACTATCPDFEAFCCTRRDRSPGACNGCPTYARCRFTKYKYEAPQAQREYEETLVQSRAGLDLEESDLARLAAIVVPAIKQGQSPYHVVQNHPELGISEKTLYNYIEQGVFRNWGLTILDLRQKTKRKMTKNQGLTYKKRKDHKYLQGRTYKDYLALLAEEPTLKVVQMDTVYNDLSGPYIQTFLFREFEFIFALMHSEKRAELMVQGIDLLETLLTPVDFRKHVQALLTDRGSEFASADAMEIGSDDFKRTRVFYCDPMASGQKGSLEKRHVELRYILPKGTSLFELGLTDQKALNLVLSHVNSAPRQKSHGKTPFELVRFFEPKLLEAFRAFGLVEVPKDDVILKPYLLKK